VKTALLLACVAVAGACVASFDVRLFTIEAPARVSAQASYGEIRIWWDPVVGATARYELEWVVGSATSRISVEGTSHVLAVSGETSLSVAGVDMNGVGPFSPSIFALPIAGLPYQPAFDQFGESVRYSYGFVVATGDLDADGIDDVVIGAPFSGPNDGSVHTLTGSTSGLAPGNSRIFPTSESNFGFSLATGRLDTDDGAEIAVGIRRFDAGATAVDAGMIQVYSATLNTMGSPLIGTESGAGMGFAVAVGPLRGDARDELVGCAPYGASSNVVIHEGVPNGGTSLVSSFGALGAMCSAVTLPGDVDNDGDPDAVFAAPAAPFATIHMAEGPNFSASSVYYTSTQVGDSLGNGSLVPAGDVNRDGFADIVAGAPSFGVGYAVLLLGTNNAFTESGWSTAATDTATGFARGIATADLNGDGWLELAIGEPDYEHTSVPGSGPGRVQLFRGIEGGFEDTPWWTAVGEGSDHLGHSIAFGDVDGNGYSDLVVGSPGDNGSLRRTLVWNAARGEGPRVDAGEVITVDAGASFVLGASFDDPALRLTHTCQWDWDGDGDVDETIPGCVTPAVPHIYTKRGAFHPKLRVEGADGRYGESVTTVIVR